MPLGGLSKSKDFFPWQNGPEKRSAEVDSSPHYLFRFEPIGVGRAAGTPTVSPKLVRYLGNFCSCGVVIELSGRNRTAGELAIALAS